MDRRNSMASIKLIATDLDGTFFGEMYYIPEANLKAVRDARDAGILVCACSARLWGTGGAMVEKGGLDRMAVFNNGAAVADAQTGEIIYKSGIAPAHFKEIIEAAASFGTVVQSWNHDSIGVYDPTNNERGRAVSERISNPNAAIRCNATFYDSIDDMAKECGTVSQKILISIDSSYLDAVVEKVSKICELEISSSNPRVIEVTMPDATKGKGVAKLAAYYGIKPENVLAIGDSHNDVSMLAFAGVKVAVQNAEDSVKRVAQHVVATNMEGGFAQAVYQLALK